MTPQLNGDHPEWPEAMAEVSSCSYDVRAGRAIALGLPSKKHFRIAYSYQTEGGLQTGEFFSATALPQGSLFPIRYNPDLPQGNSHRALPGGTRGPMLAIGVAGSVVLSTVWFFVLRGCR